MKSLYFYLSATSYFNISIIILLFRQTNIKFKSPLCPLLCKMHFMFGKVTSSKVTHLVMLLYLWWFVWNVFIIPNFTTFYCLNVTEYVFKRISYFYNLIHSVMFKRFTEFGKIYIILHQITLDYIFDECLICRFLLMWNSLYILHIFITKIF